MSSGPQGYPASSATRFAPQRTPQGRDGRRDNAQRISILIVEDDFLAAMEIESVLKEAGYEIAGVAAHADEAIQLAKSATPALVIMDIRLAGNSDGVNAALDIFRSTGIRSIFATAHYDADTRSRAQAAAPLGWLPKPYAPHALLALVKKAVEEL